jgi:hypothetical protein
MVVNATAKPPDQSEFESGVEVDARRAGLSRGGHPLISVSPRLCGLDVGLPGSVAGAAACVVALNHLGDHLGKQVTLGAFGFGVYGAGLVVVVQDLFEVVGGGVLVAAPHLVDGWLAMGLACACSASLLNFWYK